MEDKTTLMSSKRKERPAGDRTWDFPFLYRPCHISEFEVLLSRGTLVVGWDYDAWAWYDVGHDADRRERRDRGNLYLYI